MANSKWLLTLTELGLLSLAYSNHSLIFNVAINVYAQLLQTLAYGDRNAVMGRKCDKNCKLI